MKSRPVRLLGVAYVGIALATTLMISTRSFAEDHACVVQCGGTKSAYTKKIYDCIDKCVYLKQMQKQFPKKMGVKKS